MTLTKPAPFLFSQFLKRSDFNNLSVLIGDKDFHITIGQLKDMARELITCLQQIKNRLRDNSLDHTIDWFREFCEFVQFNYLGEGNINVVGWVVKKDENA